MLSTHYVRLLNFMVQLLQPCRQPPATLMIWCLQPCRNFFQTFLKYDTMSCPLFTLERMSVIQYVSLVINNPKYGNAYVLLRFSDCQSRRKHPVGEKCQVWYGLDGYSQGRGGEPLCRPGGPRSLSRIQRAVQLLTAFRAVGLLYVRVECTLHCMALSASISWARSRCALVHSPTQRFSVLLR